MKTARFKAIFAEAVPCPHEIEYFVQFNNQYRISLLLFSDNDTV